MIFKDVGIGHKISLLLTVGPGFAQLLMFLSADRAALLTTDLKNVTSIMVGVTSFLSLFTTSAVTGISTF